MKSFPFLLPFLLAVMSVLLLLLFYVVRRALFATSLSYSFLNTLYCDQNPCTPSKLLQLTPQDDEPFETSNVSFLLSHCLRLINVAYEKYSHTPVSFPSRYTVFTTLYTKSDVTIGYILLDTLQKRIWIVFRGTLDIKDVVRDVNRKQVLFSFPDVNVHQGFFLVYTVFRSLLLDNMYRLFALYPTYECIITGHSLGGALAVLTLWDILHTFPTVQCLCVTFGCPRIGNQMFVETLNRQSSRSTVFRVANTEDLFTQIPLSITLNIFHPTNPYFFIHIGKPVVFSDNRQNYTLNHSLDTYIENITNNLSSY
jgi:hypothetical protein